MNDPGSPHEARAHIQTIRQQKGLGEAGEKSSNVTDLEAALKILSEQLYQKSTHFLLEMIQNADDNQYYDQVIPTVILTLNDGLFRVDCNEIGFSPQNVEAICKIGHSTKAGLEKARGYIGEKGIGFKSVFKVADVVWVASRHYNFKFDKAAPLGEIAPIWEPFPLRMKPNWTSFVLQLSKNFDVQELVSELRSFDPRMLMFLRRLCHIEIHISRKGTPEWHTNLARDLVKEPDTYFANLRQDSLSLRYLLTRKVIHSLPTETRRPGINSTEIVLAFPIDDKAVPQLRTQQAYAFLPIRDYGFRFLMQADFLLTASREDIEISSQWNKTIANGFEEAIIETFRRFSQNQIPGANLQYSWVGFLPKVHETTGLLSQIGLGVRRRLLQESVFESQGRQFCRSSNLRWVPKVYQDAANQPLTLIHPETSNKLLSNQYPTWTLDHLKDIGIAELTPEEFLKDLSLFINLQPEKFRSKPKGFHAQLAKALVPLLENAEHREAIRRMPLIRLRGGPWVSAFDSPIFFSAQNESQAVPDGVNAQIVHAQAAKKPSVQVLYLELGVRQLSIPEICELILSTHTVPSFQPSSLSLDGLIGQVVFLFNSAWNSSQGISLWFAASTGQHYEGSKMYQRSKGKHAAQRYFPSGSLTPFLHDAYFSNVGKATDNFAEWLWKTADIWPIPRLVRHSNEGQSESCKDYDLSPDFGAILQKHGSSEALVLLRDEWRHYKKWFEPKTDSDVDGKIADNAASRLRERLSAMKVKCLVGPDRPLRATYLPRKDWVAEAEGGIAFIDVPQPEDTRWQALKCLGLGVDKDVRFYLRSLENLSGSNASVMQVSALLEQIQARVNDDLAYVKEMFETRNLILYPIAAEGEPPYWLSAKQCLWEGPSFLRRYACMCKFYPMVERLFREVLGMQNTQVFHLMWETRNFRDTDSLLLICHVLIAISRSASHALQVSPLLDREIFPIRIPSTTPEEQYSHLANGRRSSEWLIADREHLDASFSPKVALLAFKVEQALELENLISLLGLEDRLLSKKAIGVAVTEGTPILHVNYTNTLRSKADFIIRLIPDSNKKRAAIIPQIRKLEVFGVKSVRQNWSVEFQNRIVHGNPSLGHVAVSAAEESLSIYLLTKHLHSGYSDNLDDLAEQIAIHCGIEANQKWLLLLVLISNDLSVLRDQFARHGVRQLTPDEESQDFEKVVNAAKFKKSRGAKEDAEEKASLKKIRKVAEGYFTGKKIRVLSRSSNPRSGGLARGSERNESEDDTDSVKDYVVYTSDEESPSNYDSESDDDSSAGSDIGHECILFSGSKSQRTRGKAEVFVSELLGCMLPGEYDPEKHWTSKFRSRSGYELTAFEDGGQHSAFTFQDTAGTFTNFLAENDFRDATFWLERPPTYHIEVRGTRGGLSATFAMGNSQFSRMRKHTAFSADSGIVPVNVSVLVRVFNLRTQPEVTFLVDPWAMYLRDELRVDATWRYTARVPKRSQKKG